MTTFYICEQEVRMSQEQQDNSYFVPRNAEERRVEPAGSPPYFTDEGMVLVDRREARERRGTGKAESSELDDFLSRYA